MRGGVRRHVRSDDVLRCSPDDVFLSLRASDGIALLYAALGGFVFDIANTLLVAWIGIAGLAMAIPVSAASREGQESSTA